MPVTTMADTSRMDQACIQTIPAEQPPLLSLKRRAGSDSPLAASRRKLTMSGFQRVPRVNASVCQTTPADCIVQIEMVARLNNMGCACLERPSSSDLPMAKNYFRRALAQAIELIPPVVLQHCDPRDTMSSLSQQGLSKTSLYVFQRGEYDEGMHGYLDPVSLNADAVSLQRAVATIYFNVGQWNLRYQNDDEAQQSFLLARQLLGSQQGLSDRQIITAKSNDSGAVTGGVSLMAILQSLGHVQYRNGRYEDAIKTYTRALSECKTSCLEDDSSKLLELATTLNCLGVCHFHLPEADIEKALAYYNEALAIRKAVLGWDAKTKEIATILNNIGRVYYMTADHDKAMDLYSQALAMRRFLFGNDHLDVAATIFNAAQTFHHRRELDRAMALYQEFLKIAKNHLGYHHRDVAAMLKCMAQIKHECKEVEAANRLYREAIEVGRAALGDYHPEIAATLNKLGNLLYESNQLDKAVQVYREGLEVERMVLDFDHPNIVVTITNIAQIYKLQEKYDMALGLYKDAIAIQKRSLHRSDTSIACTLSSIALIYYRTRRFTQALDAYQEVLRIRRDAYGDDHVDVAATLNSVGLVLFKMDLHDIAIQSFNESLRVRRTLLGSDHRDVAVVVSISLMLLLFPATSCRSPPIFFSLLLTVVQPSDLLSRNWPG